MRKKIRYFQNRKTNDLIIKLDLIRDPYPPLSIFSNQFRKEILFDYHILIDLDSIRKYIFSYYLFEL